MINQDQNDAMASSRSSLPSFEEDDDEFKGDEEDVGARTMVASRSSR